MKIHLARQYVKLYPRNSFIGITGSVGKSSCVEACTAILSQKFKVLTDRSKTSLKLSLPTLLLKVTPQINKVILELGIEARGEMDYYLSLIQPQTIIYTKISYDHSDKLGSWEEIVEEKGKLISQLDNNGLAILNFDDPSSKKLAEICKGTVVFYGTNPQNCLIWAGNIKIEDYKTTFELNLGVERIKVNYPILGLQEVYPALAAAVLGVVNKVPLTKIKLALESVKPSEHRMEVIEGPNNSIIIDDTENSSLVSIEASIDTLQQMSARRRVLVLSEMRGLGQYSESLHRQIAQKIFKEKIDLVFLGQANAQIIAQELISLGFWEERIFANLQNSQIVSKLLKNLRKGDIVLIKGDKSIRLDEVVKRVSKKN